MVQSELDSFFVKFKNLLHAEKDATLTLKSDAGRAFVTLSVDLGHVLSEPGLQQLRPRNGPARQRRREKRAADRQVKIAAEEATLSAEQASEESEEHKSTENVDVEKVKATSNATDIVEKTVEDCEFVETTEDMEVTAEEASVLVKEPKDEMCPDEPYTEPTNEHPIPTPIPSSARPPSSFRGLGGVDYYTISYDDPSYSEDSE